MEMYGGMADMEMHGGMVSMEMYGGMVSMEGRMAGIEGWKDNQLND